MNFQSVLLLIAIINYETLGFYVTQTIQRLQENARFKRSTSTDPIDVNSKENEEDVVGIMPLAPLRAAGTRARALAFRNRARFRLHHPFLLQSTPEEFLGDENEFAEMPDEERPQRDNILGSPTEIPYTHYSMDNAPQEPEEESEIYKMHPELRGNSMEANLHMPELMPSVVLPIFQIVAPGPMEGVARTYEKDTIPNVYVNDDNYYDEPTYNYSQPSFSVIPSQWKPPSYSNLYRQSGTATIQTENYEEPIYVLRGKGYDKTAVSFNSPDDDYQRKFKEFNEDDPDILMAAHHGGHLHSHAPPHESSFSRSYTENSGHQVPHFTVNKHKATIVVSPNHPAHHFRMAQVAGGGPNTSSRQAQTGNQNSVGQKSDSIVGVPLVIDINSRRKHNYDNIKPATFIKMVMKRSLDNFHTMDRLAKNISKTKRSIPLVRLVVDPNTKVDVPKTLENMGTVMRGSFENKRTPLYHLKNAVGSTRDAFMSSLKIPPHDLFVPSKYKIVEKDGARSAQNDISDANDFDETYKKVGSMLRESVRSGQETLANVGEIYHSARKALATSRHAAPRVIMSTLRIPSVQSDHLFPKLNNTILFAPKVVELKREAVGIPHFSEGDEEFVGIGHVMDALGLSSPDANPIEFRKIVIGPMADFVLTDTIQLVHPEREVRETLNVLDNAKETVGAKNIKDFVSQMKSGFSTTFKDELGKAKNKLQVRVSAGPPEKEQAKRLDGDSTVSSPRALTLSDGLVESDNRQNNDDFTGAINPEYFRKLFNETLESAERSVLEEESRTSRDDTDLVGISMKMGQKLLTPFMGKVERKEVQVYRPHGYDDYKENWEDDGYLGDSKFGGGGGEDYSVIGNII